MEDQKKNDWLATLFFSPNITPQELADLDINPDNSTVYDIDYYKNIPQIQEAFKTDSGSFDNFKFSKYYNEVLKLYNDTDEANLEGDITNFYTYDPYDYLAPYNSTRRDISPTSIKISNPERRSFGLTNIYSASAPTMSLREVAQMNKVFNYDTEEFEGWTPNDKGGFLGGLFRPTLVLAQWDEDGEHEVNGRMVSHKKGDYKFNEDGDPYYETLGNRSVTGKDVLHYSDTFTNDGSTWNKYDFLDSDGLDKSVSGTIAKTAFRIIPMFLPKIGKFFGKLTASIELGKVLPILSNTVEGIATGDISTSKSARTSNNIRGWFEKFDQSVSDYGKQGFFNLENIGQIIGDSSMQLFQQQEIAKIPAWLSKVRNSPINDKTMKWGERMSLAYMASTSSIDSYDAFKEAGADDRIAGLGMVATMLSMYGLMNNDYFKSVWYRGTYLDRTQARSAIREAAKQISTKGFANNVAKKVSTPQGAAKWVNNLSKKLTDQFSKLKPGDIVYDSLNEGIEETMEEVSMDAVKGFFSGLNALGIIEDGKQYDFGFTPKDVASRYLSSFVGGAIGGGVFSIQGKINNRNNPILNDALSQGGDGFKEIIYLLRQGKENQLRTEIDRLHKAGKLGSTNLSGVNFEISNENGTPVITYKPANTGESQNDIIKNQLNFYIDRINEVIKEEGLDLTDKELQYASQLAIESGKSVDDVKKILSFAKQQNRERVFLDEIVNSGLYSQLFDDWNNLTSDIVKTKVALEQLLTPSNNEPSTPKDIDDKIEALRNSSEFKQLKAKLDDLREQRDSIIKGEKNDFYTGQLVFAATPQLVNNFVKGFGIHNFTQYRYNKDYDSLTEDEKNKVDQEYRTYSTTREKSRVLAAYDIFLQMQEDMSEGIKSVAERIKNDPNIFNASYTDYGWILEYWTNELNKKQEELSKAINELPEGVTTNDTIENLKSEVKDLESKVGVARKLKDKIFQPNLTEEGEFVLSRRSDFNEYANSYLSFLDYIIDNKLYLDSADGDLSYILKTWLDQNNLNNLSIDDWANRLVMTLRLKDIVYNNQEPLIVDIATKLVEAISTLKRNDINEFNNIIVTLRGILTGAEEELSNNDATEIIKSLFPNIGTQNIVDYISRIIDSKNKISSSPAYELITLASKISGSENYEILDLIKSEKLNLLNSKSVEDYIIRDKNAVTHLKETIQIIDAIKAIIDASTKNGFNSRINPYRDALKKQLLPIISDQANFDISNDLERISSQLQVLIEISDRNQAQKLREQKDIAINMRKKFASILLDPASLMRDQFIKKFGLSDLDKWISDLNIPIDVNEENFKEFEEAIIKLETLIFSHINNSNLTNEEISAKLVELFSPNQLINGHPTKLGKDPQTIITDFDQLVYLATIIGSPSQNFYNKLLEVISNPEFANAPIFSQEYAVRIAYSQILNPGLFNNVVSQIKGFADLSSDTYLNTKSVFDNMVAIFGGAGVGKTKGVASLLKAILPNSTIITCAPTKAQTDRLSESLQHTGGSLTKNELISKILGRPIQDSDIHVISDKDQNISVTSSISLNISDTNLYGDAKVKLLIIDEISQYNRIELELISRWANKNGILIIALGDYKQNSSILIHNNKAFKTGIEDGFIIKSPDLTAPLRPDNIAKYDNYVMLSEILNSIYNEYFNNSSIHISGLSQITDNKLAQNPIELKYFETNHSFGGEKFIESGDVNYYINLFKSLSNNVAVVTDNPGKYNGIPSIKVVSLNNVQGDEFDYVIIDKDLSKDSSGTKLSNFDQLKDLYTLTQRSRKGTVIVGLGRNKLPSINSRLDQTSSGSIAVTPEQINGFKQWRIDLLKGAQFDNINWEPNENSNPINPNSVIEPLPELINPNTTVNEPEDKEDQDTTSEQEDQSVTEDDNPFLDDEDISNNVNNESENRENIESNPNPEPESSTSSLNDNKEEQTEITPIQTEPSTVDIPPLSNQELLCRAEDYNDFMINSLKDYYESIDNKNDDDQSLMKYLKKSDPDIIRKITNLIRAYFVYGKYKIDLETKSTTYIDVLLDKVKNITFSSNNKLRKKVKNLINPILKGESNPEFEIDIFNGKGILSVKIGNVRIPLLVTDPIKTNHIGNISVASEVRKTNLRIGTNFISINEFTQSNINTGGLFTVYHTPVVLSVDKRTSNEYEKSQVEYILGKVDANGRVEKIGSNGKTFMVVSADPLVTDEDFKEFLIPTINPETNKIIWTTQQNSTMRVLGMDWLATIDEIRKDSLQFANNKSRAHSIIQGKRAGQIIGLAYQVEPDIITKQVKRYLGKNKNTRVVKIGNDDIGYDYAYTEDDVDTILNKYKNTDFNIILGNITDRGFQFNIKGGMDINRVMGKFTPEQWSEVDRLCNESPRFKNGIYAEDATTTNISKIYYNTDSGHFYRTDVASIIGNNFKITITENDPEKDINNDLISKLNTKLSELGFNRIITDLNNVESVIDSINEDIKKSITTEKFALLKFTGNDIISENITDIRYAIANKLNVSIDSIKISDAKTSIFVPFYVSSQNQLDTNSYNIKKYAIQQDANSEWEIIEFPIIEEYEKFYNETEKFLNNILDNLNIIKNDPNKSIEYATLQYEYNTWLESINRFRNNLPSTDALEDKIETIIDTSSVYENFYENVISKFVTAKLKWTQNECN